MSVQAVAWALSLPVPPSPKLTLVAIGNYADEHGTAWPSIERLAIDTSQSRATVQRRLKELEADGLIVRLARYERDGRRTSDEIRLRTGIKPSEVAIRRDDGRDADDDTDHPAPLAHDEPCGEAGGGYQIDTGRVANCDGEGSTALTRGGYHSCDPIEPSIEPSESLPPKPPSQPSEPPQAVRKEQAIEPHTVSQQVERFRSAYPTPSNKPEQVRSLLAALSDEEFDLALCGASGVRAKLEANPKRPPAILDAARFLRDPALWVEWGRFAPKPPPEPNIVVVGSAEWRARAVLRHLAGKAMPRPAHDGAGRLVAAFTRPLPVEALPLAAYAGDDPSCTIDDGAWPFVAKNSAQFVRWDQHLREWMGSALQERRIASGRTFSVKLPGRRETVMPEWQIGARVPLEWPPAKGTAGGAGAAIDTRATGPPDRAEAGAGASSAATSGEALQAKLKAEAEQSARDFLEAEGR